MNKRKGIIFDRAGNGFTAMIKLSDGKWVRIGKPVMNKAECDRLTEQLQYSHEWTMIVDFYCRIPEGS